MNTTDLVFNPEVVLLICGGRNFTNTLLFIEEMRKVAASFQITEIVHGACPTGADKEADQWAIDRKIKVTRFPAEWKKYGKSSGPIRNTEMFEYLLSHSRLGIALAFWDGESRGTKNMISILRKHEIATKVVSY